MQGKTVQVVSNNNSATENVYEKLSSPKYNLGFIVAALGSSKNKKLFVENQDGNYPDFTSWKTGEEPEVLRERILGQSAQLKTVFDMQERLAALRQEISQLYTELEYFNQYVDESNVNTESIVVKKELLSKNWMELWQECQRIVEEQRAVGFLLKLFQIKAFFKYGIADWKHGKRDVAKIITTFQAMYYWTKQLPNVVTDEIKDKADAVFSSFHIKEGYRYTKSFLQSVLDVMPNVTQTLLRITNMPVWMSSVIFR